MITLGNNKIAKMYLGATPVATSYLGSQQVYPNASLALSADLLAFAAAGGSQELTVAVEEGQMWALSVPVGWSASSQSGTGTATLTLTIDNNTTTVARSGALTVVSEDLTATCALAQAAGAKSYGEISIGAYGYGVLPAGGGTVSPTLAYSQPWTWNGVNGSGGTITSGATVAYSGSGVDAATGTVSASTKGTTESGQTTVATATVSVSLNGKSAAKEAVVFQEANSATYGNVTPKNITVADIPASGGTISEGTLATDFTQTISYTSGATRPGAVTYVWGDPVSAPSLGTTIQNRTKIGSLALRAYGEGSKNTYKATDVYQAGNYVSSLAVKASTFSYGTLGAGAASISPTVNADGAWTFTFSSGATSSEAPSSVYGIFSVGVTYSLGSVQNGFTVVDASTGTLTGTARGTEIGNARTSGIVTRKVDGVWTPAAAYNAAGTKTTSASKTATCTQEANARNLSSIRIAAYAADATWVQPADWGAVPAGGGYINFRRYTTYLYTSGSTIEEKNGADGDRSGMVLYEGGGWMEAWGNGGYHVMSRGVTAGERRRGTIYWTYDGLTSNHLVLYQDANVLTWNDPVISRATPVSIAAAGGTNNVASGLTYSQGGSYTSGFPASASSGGSLSYAVQTAKTGFSLSGSTVTVTNNTSTSARNGFVVRITLTLNGKTATKDITYNQAAGSYTYANPVVSVACADVPASGGSVTSGTATYSQTYGWNGAMSGAGTLTSGGTVTWSGGASNIASLGATVKSRTAVGSALVATVTMNGKSGSGSATVYQQANTFSDNSMKLHFGSFTGANTITVGAGSSSTAVYLEVTRLYTSGVYQPGHNVTTGGTFTVSETGFSISGSNVIAASRGTTTGAARSGTVTGKYNALTATGTITQAENKITNSDYNASNSQWSVGATIGSGMTAAGGSATITRSASHLHTNYRLYSSGSTDGPFEDTVVDNVNLSIVSNGNNRFSLSGTTLTHSNMGTNAVTDTITIRATNVSNASTYRDVSASVTNSVVSSDNLVVTSYSYPTISYSGGSVSPTVAGQRRDLYASGSYKENVSGFPSGITYRYTNVGMVSGFSINTSTGVVTASANSSSSSRSNMVRVTVATKNNSANKSTNVTQAGVPGPTRVNISINNPQLTGGEVVIAFSPACYDTLTILVMGYLQDGSLYSVYRNVGGGITEDRFYPNGAWADSASIENIDGEGIPPVTKTRGIYYW